MTAHKIPVPKLLENVLILSAPSFTIYNALVTVFMVLLSDCTCCANGAHAAVGNDLGGVQKEDYPKRTHTTLNKSK